MLQYSEFSRHPKNACDDRLTGSKILANFEWVKPFLVRCFFVI